MDEDETWDPYTDPNGPPGQNETAPPTPSDLGGLTAAKVGPLIMKEVG